MNSRLTEDLNSTYIDRLLKIDYEDKQYSLRQNNLLKRKYVGSHSKDERVNIRDSMNSIQKQYNKVVSRLQDLNKYLGNAGYNKGMAILTLDISNIESLNNNKQDDDYRQFECFLDMMAVSHGKQSNNSTKSDQKSKQNIITNTTMQSVKQIMKMKKLKIKNKHTLPFQ